MAHWSDSEIAKNAPIGTRLEVSQADFSFRLSADKAMTTEQITAALPGVAIPENGKVWAVKMANTLIDRHNERFSKPYLERIAKQLNESSETFNLFHDRRIPVGKVLPKAALIPMEGKPADWELTGYVWVNNKATIPDQPMISVNEAIETGSLKDVSVEVSGSIQYVDAPEGSGMIGIWEWYVNPERPEIAEITGLALVQKGAQRGAGATTVKSIGGQTIKKEEIKLITMYKEKYFVNDKEYSVTAKQDGTEIKAEGIESLVADYKDAVKATKAAETAKTEAEAAKTAAEAETKEIKDALTAEVMLLEKALGKTAPRSLEDLGKLKTIELYKSAEALRKEYDGNGTANGEKSLETKIPSYRIQ